MSDGPYEGYLKHKLDQLWKKVEELESRVEEMESGQAPQQQGQGPQPGMVPVEAKGESSIRPPRPQVEGGGYQKPVVAILREKGPLNVVDVNAELKSQGVQETVRDTLFNRLKPLMQKGVVSYDKETQKFSAA